MRTNIVLDDELVAEAMQASGATTKREVVDLALREFVNKHRQREVLDLVGQDLIDPDYDVIAVRHSMLKDAGWPCRMAGLAEPQRDVGQQTVAPSAVPGGDEDLPRCFTRTVTRRPHRSIVRGVESTIPSVAHAPPDS